jgi:hypothetical protein
VTTPAFTPLSSRAVYRTSDPEVATREAARLFARHRLRVLDGPARFDAMANVGDLSGVAINYVRFSTRSRSSVRRRTPTWGSWSRCRDA